MSRTSKLRAAALAAAIGVGLLPPVQARFKAAAVMADVLGLPLPRPFAHVVTGNETQIADVHGDLYEPVSGPAPGVLLIPGAAPRGKDDSRVVALAEAISKAGRSVFVPSMDLADRRFTEDDLTRIKTAVDGLTDDGRGPVTVLGFSYGGSLALVAAADPATASQIEQVAVFGAYWDLLGLVQAATTRASIVGDERIPWEPDERVDEIVHEAAVLLVPRDERDDLEEALERGSGVGLPVEARAVFDLVTNDHPERTFELAERLGPTAASVLRDFSPAAVAGDIDVPVIALHSIGDPVTPYAETLRLERAMPEARVLIVDLFDHVDFEGGDIFRAVPGLFQTWRFASWVLSPGE